MNVRSVCWYRCHSVLQSGKERDNVRQFAQTSQKEGKEKKRKEKKGKTVFEGNDISKTDDFAAAAGPTPSVGYHYSRGHVACRQTMREQPSLKFTEETLTSTHSQVLGID